jgi:hypothetical protein
VDAVNWTVRVHAAGRRRAIAYARDHRFEIGAPVEFDETAATVSALEYALAALAGDLVNTFSTLARRQRLEVDAIEAVVTGALNNPLTVLQVVGEDGHPGLEHIALKLYVGSSAPAADVNALWEETQTLSPLVLTLRSAVTLDLDLVITP